MAWLFILIADVFEVAWPFALKWSVKFSSWSPLIVAMVSSIPVMFLLAEAVNPENSREVKKASVHIV